MQDTLGIKGAGYGYDFTELYTLENGYSILVRLKNTTQIYNINFLKNF